MRSESNPGFFLTYVRRTLGCATLLLVPYDQYPRDRLVEFGRANQPKALAGKQAKADARHLDVLKMDAALPFQQAVARVMKKYEVSEDAAKRRIYRARAWAEKNKASKDVK